MLAVGEGIIFNLTCSEEKMEAHRGGVLLVIFLHLLITQFNKICAEGVHIPWALSGALGIQQWAEATRMLSSCALWLWVGSLALTKKAQMHNYQL